jgi:nucleotide-binding universal stress UspA family protein
MRALGAPAEDRLAIGIDRFEEQEMDMETVQRIVVGVDGSTCSATALLFACDEAKLRGVELVVVMAWSYLDQHHVGGSSEFRPDYDSTDAAAALDEFVRGVLGDDPDVSLRIDPVNDLPVSALLDTVGSDDLLVVGSRGRGGFRGMLLGSVSLQCVHHARCPVLVIRADSEADRAEQPGV